jgi:DNA modification methylase
MTELIHGDCLEEMKKIPDGSIDLVLTDPPYGTTACKWDTVIPFEPMWEQLKRVTKKNGAIVLFGSQPFTSALVMSNIKMFKYEWVWEKSHPTGFGSAKTNPLKYHENITVFYSKAPVYNPQFWEGKPNHSMGKIVNGGEIRSQSYIKIKATQSQQSKKKYPKSVQKFNNPRTKGMHPTQKPVALMEYLIKTYTNEGETVLDFTMGSGTTGVACKNLNRNFIGIELDKEYFEIAKERIETTQKPQ